MQEFFMIVFVLISVVLVGLILIQQGKGADMGASFGAGASATVFGSSGSGNFLTRATAICATLFLCLALFLGYLSSHTVVDNKDFIDSADEMPSVSEPVVSSTEPASVDSAAVSVPEVTAPAEISVIPPEITLDSPSSSEDNTAQPSAVETQQQ